jgi:exopolyphosphatase/pppGpp-phosphohydrolase
MSKDRSLAELEADFVAIARGESRPTAFTTLLHIGDEHLVVLTGQGSRPETVQQLDLGAARVAAKYFRHDPPTSQDIERAIDFAEDEIMRLGKAATTTTTPASTSAALQAWACVSGPTMQLEAIEQWFQRLASTSLGQPAAMQGLPTGREAAATLLVLREFMHHRGYATIVFVERP